jgi:hypothetical protein
MQIPLLARYEKLVPAPDAEAFLRRAARTPAPMPLEVHSDQPRNAHFSATHIIYRLYRLESYRDDHWE